MAYSYAIDGKCHNAEPGTYGHEGHPITLPNWDARYPARADIVSGHVEHNGERFSDPLFEPAATVAVKTAKSDPVLRLVASIGKLGVGDLERIRAAIDARLAA